jgi:prepilin-type N-terminal cleavage/methylation domain-containing protein
MRETKPSAGKLRFYARRGFTLIELISVLVLLAFLLVVGAVHQARTNVDMAGAAETLKAHIRYAQTLNSVDNKNDWHIHVTKYEYSLRKSNSVSPIPLPGSDTYIIQFPGKVTKKDGSPPNMYIHFDEYGRPAGGVDIVIPLYEKRGWIITGVENSYDIVVKADTGQVL